MQQFSMVPVLGRATVSETTSLCAAVLALGIAILTCQEAWAASVSPGSVIFQAVQGAENPPSQAISVNKGSSRQASWTATESATWLSLSPGTGTITKATQITLSVNTSGLASGSYTTTVFINLSKGGTASLPITLIISPATTTSSGTTTTNSSSGTTTSTTNTSAILSWDLGSESNLAGYKIYVGTASGTYSYPGSPFTIGKLNTYTISNLPTGQSYFFAVSAFDTSGNNSALSAEVSKSIY